MSLKSKWNNLSLTEKLLLGMVFTLILLIIARWEFVSKGVSDGFKRFFEKHSNQ